MKKTLPLLSVVQHHAWCQRNGLEGNSEYAILLQFTFAETVGVFILAVKSFYRAIHGLLHSNS